MSNKKKKKKKKKDYGIKKWSKERGLIKQHNVLNKVVCVII